MTGRKRTIITSNFSFFLKAKSSDAASSCCFSQGFFIINKIRTKKERRKKNSWIRPSCRLCSKVCVPKREYYIKKTWREKKKREEKKTIVGLWIDTTFLFSTQIQTNTSNLLATINTCKLSEYQWFYCLYSSLLSIFFVSEISENVP